MLFKREVKGRVGNNIRRMRLRRGGGYAGFGGSCCVGSRARKVLSSGVDSKRGKIATWRAASRPLGPRGSPSKCIPRRFLLTESRYNASAGSDRGIECSHLPEYRHPGTSIFLIKAVGEKDTNAFAIYTQNYYVHAATEPP